MSFDDFLFELGCDELPAKSLAFTAEALSDSVANLLKQAQLTFEKIDYYATPRRIAVLVHHLSSEQPSQIIERQGPSIEAAFDKSGTPTLACIGFARSCGVSTDQLQIKETDKGKRIFCEVKQVGHKTATLLSEIIPEAVYKLPLSKPMRWGQQEKAFIRPVQWIVALYGQDIVDVKLFGLKAHRTTYAHRFHHPTQILLMHPKDYARQLKNPGMVIADIEERKNNIREQIEKKSAHYGRALVDEKLLNEVTALVEWPVVLIGTFKPEFLKVPAEVVVSSIKNHQKSFPIINAQNFLEPYFVIISNIESKDPKTIITGNERVINARLADAAFFYKNDLSTPLQTFFDRLKTVVFQKQLGTLEARTQRLMRLTTSMAEELKLNSAQAHRSAELAKFDLMSEMVGEFPELQGVMGYYYARQSKEPESIASAIREHYYPRFSKDRLPQDTLSAALAIADRLDLIVGILGVHLTPSGEKDPYALKRAAQGVIRILIEKRLPLDLYVLLQTAYRSYTALPNTNVVEEAFEFIHERLRAWYLEQGVSTEAFAAVAACLPKRPLDFDRRLKAVQQFQNLPESSALAAANKRVSNILKKTTEPLKQKKVEATLFESDAERKLARLLDEKVKQVHPLYEKANYSEALCALATLKEPVDTFFDQVMIMVDNPKVRANRLTLLTELHQLFTQVADISLLP